MTFDGFVGVGAVLCGISLGESWPGIIVTFLDNREPSRHDWESRRGVEVTY